MYCSAVCGIVEHEVAVRERPSLGVLSGQPDRHPLHEQACERQRFGLPPVDPTLVDRLEPPIELPLQLGVHGETLGDGQQLLVELPKPVGGDRRDHVRSVRGRRSFARSRPGGAEGGLQPLVGFSEQALDLGDHRVRLFLGHDSFVDEAHRILLPRARMLLDARDHQRLRVRRLVALVVSPAPVADQVDDDVVAEPASEAEREPDRRDRRLGVVRVDVDDRDVEALRQVARVARRAPIGRVRGEPDLVVRDHVQRAAGRVAAEPLEVERLGDDALGRERRVAVDQDRERDTRVVRTGARRAIGLLGPGQALDDGVDGLEVARVGGERDGDVARRRISPSLSAEVVLDVAALAGRLRLQSVERPLALELAQDRVVRTADHVGEDVEPAAVGHPDQDLVRAVLGRELDRGVEHRDERVEPLDRELLLAEERAVEVALHAFHLGEARQQAALLVG